VRTVICNFSSKYYAFINSKTVPGGSRGKANAGGWCRLIRRYGGKVLSPYTIIQYTILKYLSIWARDHLWPIYLQLPIYPRNSRHVFELFRAPTTHRPRMPLTWIHEGVVVDGRLRIRVAQRSGICQSLRKSYS